MPALRTEESTRLGVKWFDGSPKWLYLVTVVYWVLLGGTVFVFLNVENVRAILIGSSRVRFPDLFTCVLIVLVLSGVAIALTTSAVRVAATVTGLVLAFRATIGSVPRNWWRVVTRVDLAAAPVLLPEAKRGPVKEFRDLRYAARPLTYGAAGVLIGALLAGLALREFKGWRRVVLSLQFLAICFAMSVTFTVMMIVAGIPAWFYRLSLQGTSLLWAPLAVLVWEGPRRSPDQVADSFLVSTLATVVGLPPAAFVLGAALRRGIGTDLLLLRPYEAVAEAAAKHEVAAAFFPKDGVPVWQWFVLAGAIVILAGRTYAGRLKGSKCSETQKRCLDVLYYALGFIAVALIFSWIYTAGSVANWEALPIFD